MTKGTAALSLKAAAESKLLLSRLFCPATTFLWKRNRPLCHPERSEGSAVQRTSPGNVSYLPAPGAQPQDSLCDSIRCVADHIPLSRKVPCDAANPERLNRFDIRDDRRSPFPGIAIQQNL